MTLAQLHGEAPGTAPLSPDERLTWRLFFAEEGRRFEERRKRDKEAATPAKKPRGERPRG